MTAGPLRSAAVLTSPTSPAVDEDSQLRCTSTPQAPHAASRFPELLPVSRQEPRIGERDLLRLRNKSLKLLAFAMAEVTLIAPPHQKVEPLLLLRRKLPQSFLRFGERNEFRERNAAFLANRCRQFQIEPFDLGMLVAEAVEALEVDLDSALANPLLQFGHVDPALAKNYLQPGMCNRHAKFLLSTIYQVHGRRQGESAFGRGLVPPSPSPLFLLRKFPAHAPSPHSVPQEVIPLSRKRHKEQEVRKTRKDVPYFFVFLNGGCPLVCSFMLDGRTSVPRIGG